MRRSRAFSAALVSLVVATVACVPETSGDTTGPSLEITNHTSGETVDGSHGELLTLQGTVSDPSGVASLVLTAPDGSTLDGEFGEGRWATSIGAPVTGPASFTVTATDNAGNNTIKTISLNLIALPDGSGDVVRPTTLQLDGAAQSALAAVTGTALVFNGDLRALLAGRVVVTSSPVAPIAPHGFLRTIEEVVFDAVTVRTTVTTTEAELVDAFARLSLHEDQFTVPDHPEFTAPEQPAARGASPSVSAQSACHDFVSGYRMSVRAAQTFNFTRDGGAPLSGDSTVGVSATLEIAIRARMNIDIDVGWTGVDVSGELGAGAMICGSAEAFAAANFGKDRPFPGMDNLIVAGLPVLGIPVTLRLSAGIRSTIAVDAASPKGSFHAGVSVSSDLHDADIDFPSGATADGSPMFSGKLALGVYAKLGLSINDVAKVGLLDAYAAREFKGTVGQKLESCRIIEGAFAPSLTLKIPHTPWKVTVFKLRFPFGPKPDCTTIWAASRNLSGATQLASDGRSTCAIVVAGQIKCWGNNDDGQLGDGTTISSTTPVTVVDLVGATSVIAIKRDFLRTHTTFCAILAAGQINCWGDNSSGQLGSDTPAKSSVPVAVTGVSAATALVGTTSTNSGGASLCAIVAGGQVKCWGDNLTGQLGNGTTSNSATPVLVTGIANAVALAAGAGYDGASVCAVVSGGQVRCWGDNHFGELGDSAGTNASLPQSVAGLAGVSSLASSTQAVGTSSAGGAYGNATSYCGVASGGVVRCWGGIQGPALPEGGVRTLGASSHGAYQGAFCGIGSSGEVACWGSALYGESIYSSGLYEPGMNFALDPAVAIGGVTGATALSSDGVNAVCAIVNAGAVRCWGNNDTGQLGNGSVAASAVGVAAVGVSEAQAIGAVGYGFCAIVTGGAIKCWGDNGSGQLGNGTTSYSSVPTNVLAGA